VTPLEYFRIVATQYASMSDQEVQVWIGIAELTSADFSGCLGEERYNLALALLAAHLITVQNSTAGSGGAVVSGPITSEKEGDLSRTYANNVSSSSSSNPLDSTTYGKQYMSITLACVGAPIMTRIG